VWFFVVMFLCFLLEVVVERLLSTTSSWRLTGLLGFVFRVCFGVRLRSAGCHKQLGDALRG
jgi:hypothetical protein